MKDLRLRKFSAVLSLFAAYGLMTTTGKAQATTTTTSTTTTTTPAPAATTTSDQEPQVLEKFVVTGSNIPMAADALAVPVTVIGQQQIEESGVSSSILEILRKGSPQFSGNGNIGNENAQVQTNTYGGASVAIHNLPTLVLIDGQRVAVDPITAQGGGEFVDVNMIPVAAVDRIEVLSDGASAIYGSDAIGGVVNIILKKDFNGFDIGARYAFTTNAGHYAERQGWIVGGAANDSTSILTSVEFTEQDPIFEKDRSYSNPYYGTNTYPGHLDVFLGSGGFADQFYQLAPGVNAPPGGGLYTIDQLVSMGVYVPITPTQSLDALNLANAETLSQSLKRASALTNITHKIFGEKLEGYASILFSNVKTISQLNGQPIVPYLSTPYTDLIDEGTTPPPTGATYIPLSAPTNPFSAAFINGNQDFASGALVLPRMRLLNFPRTENNDDTLIRIVGGLKGKVSDALQWDVSANLNRYELNYTNGGLINTANLNAAFADGTLNPFAINQAPGVLPGDIVGSAFFNGVSTLNDFNAKIFGNVFDVPGGQIGYSLGVEYQVAQLSAQVDANSLPDPDTGTTVGWSNSVSLQPFQAQRDILSVYAEVSAPLIGASENIPFVHSLNLDIAGRYDDYSAIGGSKVPKASLSYEPIDDTLKIRFSASKSFIAPTLYDLYGPSSTGSTDLLTYNNFGGGPDRPGPVQLRLPDQSGTQALHGHGVDDGICLDAQAGEGPGSLGRLLPDRAEADRRQLLPAGHRPERRVAGRGIALRPIRAPLQPEGRASVDARPAERRRQRRRRTLHRHAAHQPGGAGGEGNRRLGRVQVGHDGVRQVRLRHHGVDLQQLPAAAAPDGGLLPVCWPRDPEQRHAAEVPHVHHAHVVVLRRRRDGRQHVHPHGHGYRRRRRRRDSPDQCLQLHPVGLQCGLQAERTPPGSLV
jgi:iron complex outermembrane receptor protein